MEGARFKRTVKTDQILQNWNSNASLYCTADATLNSNYYTLLNMLEISQARHILQIGCGIGKLIPQLLSMKSEECTFTATDLSPVMVNLAQQNLEAYLRKIGVTEDFEVWMKNKKVSFESADAEIPMKIQFKFDRIMANLVLHIAQNPIKMMQNLYEMAEQGCLLTVSIIGREEHNDLRKQIPEAYHSKTKERRADSPLCGHLRELGQLSGWQTVLQWSQSSPLVFSEVDDKLRSFIVFVTKQTQEIVDYIMTRSASKLKSRRALQVQTELVLYRKKTERQSSPYFMKYIQKYQKAAIIAPPPLPNVKVIFSISPIVRIDCYIYQS